jgi:metal-responsive CopG/Arc/MetJ family transcriptional regulator
MASPSQNPKTEQVITLLTVEDREALDAMADHDKLSRSEMVRDLIRDATRARGFTAAMQQITGQMPLYEEE